MAGVPAADTDAAVLRRNEGHADEDATGDQALQHPAREGAVLATVDGDEIGGRGQRRKTVVAGDGGDAARAPSATCACTSVR